MGKIDNIVYPSNFNKLDKDTQEDIDEAIDIFSFERFCGSCDNIDTDNCPFLGIVFPGTEWEKMGCNRFSD